MFRTNGVSGRLGMFEGQGWKNEKGHQRTGNNDIVIAKRGHVTRFSLLEQQRKAAHHVFYTGSESEIELNHVFSNGKAPWKAIYHVLSILRRRVFSDMGSTSNDFPCYAS